MVAAPEVPSAAKVSTSDDLTRPTTSFPVFPLDGPLPLSVPTLSGSHPDAIARLVVVAASPLSPPPLSPSPRSKSPLFIANGFRIMMPWVAAGPYSNTSCFLVRTNSVPSPPSPSCSARALARPLAPSRAGARGCYCRRRDCSRSRSFE